MSIMGVGYEGLTPDALVSRLRVRSVDLLVDVRLNPISRKVGFSKKALTSVLEEAGIAYLHLPALGNARDNRDGYSQINSPAAKSARLVYEASLEGEAAQESLARLAQLTRSHNVAVFCFEADEKHCHREQVLEAVHILITHEAVSA